MLAMIHYNICYVVHSGRTTMIPVMQCTEVLIRFPYFLQRCKTKEKLCIYNKASLA